MHAPAGQKRAEKRLNAEQVEHFNREGYAVVPGFLDDQQVAELRGELTEIFSRKPVHAGDLSVAVASEGRGGGVRHDIFSRYPSLRWMMVEPELLGALRSLLGEDFVFLPEMGTHDSRYGFWHKDTTPMERDGLTFHLEPTFKMVQCAIYLQDNTEYGGGLDVVPGSHTEPDHTPPPPKLGFIDRVRAKLGLTLGQKAKHSAMALPDEPGAISIPSKAGDLVIFNVMLNHQATQPTTCETDEIPEEHRKFALFFVCSANNEHARSYRDYIAGQYEHLKKGHEYPAEVLELASEHGVTLI